MIGTESGVLASLKRTEQRPEATAWPAEAPGFTSRKVVLRSLGGPPGRRVATPIVEPAADGGRTWPWPIETDARASAIARHLERYGAPGGPTHEASAADVAALERASRADSTPVPTRAAAPHALGHAAAGAGRTPGRARGRDRP